MNGPSHWLIAIAVLLFGVKYFRTPSPAWAAPSHDEKRHHFETVSRMVEAELSERGYDLADVPDAM